MASLAGGAVLLRQRFLARPHPVPQAWLEFEVENVEKATADLESRGHQMLIKNKAELWGQTVSRFLSPEGLPVAVTFTPSLREQK